MFALKGRPVRATGNAAALFAIGVGLPVRAIVVDMRHARASFGGRAWPAQIALRQ